jgi:Zn-finger nucleic acid-binding protein
METVQVEDVQIDRCTKCGGLWFDEFELADLQAKPGSAKVDTGHASQSAQHSQVRINCPKCAAPMLRMVDAEQPHIWYETCGACRGSFLDAGEFKDLIQHSFVARLKDFLVQLKGGRSTNTATLSPAVLRKILK